MKGLLVKSADSSVFGQCALCGVKFETEECMTKAMEVGQIYSNTEGDGFTYEIVYYHRCQSIPAPSNIVETDGFDY